MKNLFQKIVLWVKGMLGSLLDHFKGIAVVAVNITDKLKTIVESEVLDIVVDLIPGDVDDKILDKVRAILPIVIAKVSLSSNIIEGSESNSEAIAKLVEHLKSLNPEGRKAFWVLFSAELNIALSDGKLSFSEGVILSQLVYNEIRRSKK